MDKRFLETGLHNEEGCEYERVTKNDLNERKEGKRVVCAGKGGGGDHGFRKFATQVGRKIGNE